MLSLTTQQQDSDDDDDVDCDEIQRVREKEKCARSYHMSEPYTLTMQDFVFIFKFSEAMEYPTKLLTISTKQQNNKTILDDDEFSLFLNLS